jgi:hypothetical protein
MEHPQEAVAIVMSHSDTLTLEHETNMLREVFKLMVNENTEKHGMGYLYTPDWVVMAKILFQQKLIKAMPDITKAINASFIDKVKIYPPKG